MTDISGLASSVPSRLGVMARYHDGELVLELAPPAETRHHGIVRASVLAFMIDAVAGIPMDQDAEAWTLTSDMTVRMRPIPAPARIDATTTTVRQSSRSATSMVELVTEAGAPIAVGAIGFVKVRRKETDPPKPVLPPGQAPMVLRRPGALTRPLREEAGIEVVDAGEGVVHVEVTQDLRNPAGTLQGAMVALIAEAAAEELLGARFEVPVVVTDLDLRYLRKTDTGPVQTRSRLLGTAPDASVQVEIIDTSTDQILTLVYARAVPAP